MTASRRKKERDGYHSGPPLYGLRLENKRPVPDPVEQTVVRRVRELRSQGVAWETIADMLNAEGVPTRKGGRWHAGTLVRIFDAELRDRTNARRRALRGCAPLVPLKCDPVAEPTGLDLIGYVRVSTETQGLEGFGLPVQRRAIELWAGARGHRLVAIVEEVGSGVTETLRKSAFPAVLEAVQDGEAAGVVVYNLDRLARTLTAQEAILARVWELDGRVFTVESGEVLRDDRNDPMRTAMRQMRGVFSQLERSMLLKRMADGRRAKAERGGYAYRRAPYGWRVENRALVPDEREQAVLVRMRAMREEGLSCFAIANALNDDGVPTKFGKQWAMSTVWRIVEHKRAKDWSVQYEARRKARARRVAS